MNIFRRPTAAIPAYFLAALALGAAPAPSEEPRGRAIPAATVEPTLDLLIDLELEGVEKRGGGLEARLRLDLSAFADLRNVVIRPILPPDLVTSDPDAVPDRLATISRGPARRFFLPLRSSVAGKRTIRVEVEFEDAAGRRFRLAQGITLDPDPAPEGQVRAGAYEVMATPVEKVRP